MLKTAKIVGLNSDTEAALALASGGGLGLFAVVTCAADDAFSRARQALAEAEETFFSSDQTISVRLGETLEIVKKSLSDTENLQVLLAAVTEDQESNVLYLLGEGESLRGYLVRSGKENDLFGKSCGQIVSGVLEPGDRVILATKSLLEFLGDSHILEGIPINILEDEINANLPEAENYPVAAIVLETEGKVKEDPEEILPIPQSPKSFNLPSKMALPSKKVLTFLGAGVLVLTVLGLGFFVKQRQEAGVAKIKLQEQKTPGLSGQGSVNPAEARKVFSVNDIPLWLDLSLIKDGFTVKRLSLSLGKLLVLDDKQKTLVNIGLKNKSHQILAGEEKLGEAQIVSLNGDLAWVLSEDKGLLRVMEDKKALVVTKPDKEWGEIAELFGFARNAYLLDKGGQVWKYVPVEAGYSDKIKYFKEGVRVDFSQVKRMQIDSSVWVLKDNGEILKFTQGVPDYFSLSGLDKGIKDARSFFISDETENLYILDSGNNRLVVVDKKGAYVSQYQGDKFGLFEDLVVDEGGKKVYLLDEGKIFQMELKL